MKKNSDSPGLIVSGTGILPVPDRFWDKVVFTGTCWSWTGGKYSNGYGRFRPDPKDRNTFVGAHRFSWEYFYGEIGEGMCVDHLCHNIAAELGLCDGGWDCVHRSCVSPHHLDLITNRENLQRSPLTLQGAQSRRTHCIHGHEFTDDNTYWWNGHRRCKECDKIRKRVDR